MVSTLIKIFTSLQRRSSNLIHPRPSFLTLALLLKLGIS